MEHTNLRKKRMIKITVIFLIIILGFTVLSRTIYELLLPQVTITKVMSGRVENKFLTTGQIGKDALAIKSKKVVVKTPESGIMTNCFVEEGQTVTKGQPLFTITLEKDQNEEAQADYNKAEIEITLEGIQNEIEEKIDKKARIEIKIADKKVEMEKDEKSYEVIQVENQINDKTEEMMLNKQLLEVGAVAESTYKQSEEGLLLLKKKKEQLERDEKEKKKADLLEIEEELESLKSEIDDLKAKETLEHKKMDTMVQVEKEITVVSPISGTIYEVNLAEGIEVGKGEDVVEIIPKEIAVTLTLRVDQQQADQIKMKQEVAWTLNREEHQATVVKKTYDSEKDQIIITCGLSDEDISNLALDNKTYKTVDIHIDSQSEEYDQLVNNAALVREDRQTYVYTIKEDKKPFEVKYFVYKVPVTVIKEGDMTSAVSSELSYNQDIIKTTSKPLHDGVEVSRK